jgi:hypothetical protein
MGQHFEDALHRPVGQSGLDVMGSVR